MLPAEAAKELLRRDRAAESLLDYAKYIDIPGAPVDESDDDNWQFNPVESDLAVHHMIMLQTIEKVIIGELPRAMLFCPPGTAKSTYGSVVAPTWAMGRKPGTQIILTSYGAELAKKHGRKARQIVKSDKFNAVFDDTISKETAAADFWTTINGSEYMSSGILAGVTGNRADGLLLDDPVKGRQDADSEAKQKATWEAYQEDLRTRLKPGGWEIIIQTRWSENDVSGKLLPEGYNGETGMVSCRDGRDWFILCLPAQHQADYPPCPIGRKPGDYLWPGWFTPEHFEGFKAQIRTWSALFQQRPQPPEGTFFQRQWFERYKIGGQPKQLNHYITSDHAPGGEDHNDFNAFRVWGVDPDNHIWLRAGFREQETLDKSIAKVIPLIKQYKPFVWFPEDDNNWKAIQGFVSKELLKNKAYCRIEPLTPHGADKQTKAQPFQAMASMGMVHIPEGVEGDSIIDQYIRFPTGANDDEVDAAAIMGRVIDAAHPAMVEIKVPEEQTTAQQDFDLIYGIVDKPTDINIEDNWEE